MSCEGIRKKYIKKKRTIANLLQTNEFDQDGLQNEKKTYIKEYFLERQESFSPPKSPEIKKEIISSEELMENDNEVSETIEKTIEMVVKNEKIYQNENNLTKKVKDYGFGLKNVINVRKNVSEEPIHKHIRRKKFKSKIKDYITDIICTTKSDNNVKNKEEIIINRSCVNKFPVTPHNDINQSESIIKKQIRSKRAKPKIKDYMSTNSENSIEETHNLQPSFSYFNNRMTISSILPMNIVIPKQNFNSDLKNININKKVYNNSISNNKTHNNVIQIKNDLKITPKHIQQHNTKSTIKEYLLQTSKSSTRAKILKINNKENLNNQLKNSNCTPLF